MKKRMIAGVWAAFFAVSAVTGISAASDVSFPEGMQEEFQDEKEEVPSSEWEEEKDFSEDAPDDLADMPEMDFGQEAETGRFEVITEAEHGTVVFGTEQEQEYFFAAGEAVGFYIYSFEGYECTGVTAEYKGGSIPVTLGEDQRYEFFMPESTVTLRAEFQEIQTDETEEAEIFTDGEEEAAAARASARAVTVKSVSADYKMNPEYAFTYAFRKGVTKLTSVQGASSDLPGKLDGQFGWSENSVYGPNYKNTFSACSIQNASQKGKISVRYTNVGEYRGKIVDLKITATEWGTVSNRHIGVDNTVITPCILFYNNRIAFSTISVGAVRFKFEFFDNSTGNQIYPKGHVTMMDLDGGQGFRVYDGWGVDGMYIRSGYDHLKATTGTSSSGTQYTEVRAPEGVSTEARDVKGWCHVDFGGVFTVNWLSGAAGLNATSPYSAFFISGAQTVGTYEPNSAPEKKVGDTGSLYEEMICHEEKSDVAVETPYNIPENGEFDYVISQNVLPGNYNKFEVTDSLDSCLEYKSATVMTALGNDVTRQFDISETQNTVRFVAKSSFLNTDESCNDVTYYFRIHVGIKSAKTIVGHGHYEEGIYYHIANQAERSLESSRKVDEQQTNISWVRGVIESDCSIRKTDAQDHEKILPGAVFEVYQWDKTKQGYEQTGQNLAYIDDTKLYVTTEKLRYDTTNEGKFRLIEIQPPEGYEGNWKKDINILEEDFQDTVLEAENTLVRLPCGEITVTKKIREQDIIWAHGNPVFRFEISGTDQKGMFHRYEDYVEFQDRNYERQGGYAILSYTFHGIPLGNYSIHEKETLRYSFQGIIAETSNVEITGREAKVFLDRENRAAAVTFLNQKIRYDGYSHTDVIRNTIPVE